MARNLFITAAAVAAFAALSASPVLAQSRISVGQTQQGALTASDPALGDGSHFDCWLFDAPGGSVTVNLQSSGFDTVVMVGAGANCGDNSDAATVNDDGPGMGTNSQAVLSNARGPHWIVVNSYGAGETGNYTLSLVGAGGGGNTPNAKPAAGGGASGGGAGGRAQSGSLRPTDPAARYQWDIICLAADTVALILAAENMNDAQIQAWMTESGRLQNAGSASARAIGKTDEQMTNDIAEYGAAWLTDDQLLRDAPPAQMRASCLQNL